MAAQGNPKVPISFLYIEGTNPVFVFADAKEATKFSHEFKGGHFHSAEIYGDPNHVFLPRSVPFIRSHHHVFRCPELPSRSPRAQLTLHRPHGLESVRASSTGVIGYIFHNAQQAKHWLQRVNATSVGEVGWQAQDGSREHERTVFVGVDRKANEETHAPSKQGT